MFVLSEMKDVIRVTPEYFHQSLSESITTLLNRKLANKVVLNVGLCIALFDITHIGHSYIFPGDGSSHTEVKFRYIVFRPIVEEILIGKIRSCSREGVHVTLGFFDDILIPVSALQHPSRFDETDQAWVWEYPKEDGEKHDLFMDSGEDTGNLQIPDDVAASGQGLMASLKPQDTFWIDSDLASKVLSDKGCLIRSPFNGETIRFRVTSEAFEESLPTGPPGSECAVQTVAPYRVVGGINEPGLGLLSWWEAPEQDDGNDDDTEQDEE